MAEAPEHYRISIQKKRMVLEHETTSDEGTSNVKVSAHWEDVGEERGFMVLPEHADQAGLIVRDTILFIEAEGKIEHKEDSDEGA